MKKLLLAMLAVPLSLMAGWLEEKSTTRVHSLPDGRTLPYRLFAKESPDGSRVPLVVYLHGAGERGTDNAKQISGRRDIIDWLDANEKGYILVAGQVPEGKRWVEVDWAAPSHTMPQEPSDPMTVLLDLVDSFLTDPRVDTNRVYATGLSMGGYGTWDIVCRRPEIFAAVMPICGGADEAQAARIAHVPLWTFHGSADRAVPVSRSRNMMAALWAAGSNAHYREFPDWPHDVWTPVYGDGDILKWFFSQHK